LSRTQDLNLAVIGNCQIAALIDATGSIIWACLPRLDGDPVFSALLNDDAAEGRFSIAMQGATHIRQRYLRNTAVLETIHEGPDATVRVTDFCPRFTSHERIYRPAMIIRIVESLMGKPVICVRLRPTANYGEALPRVTFSSHSVRFSAGDLSYRNGDLLFRYRHADDFGVPTTTFTVCAFWYVNALAAVGRMEEARELFGKLLSRRNPVGLLSEDIDPVTGELWGNFPQTYSMVGIIVSALRLSRQWEEVV
jgi:GH15 family glucan-1,4-alpha-glucosidase